MCSLLILAAAAPAAEPGALSAIFLRVEGKATVTSAGAAPAREIRPAMPLQRLEPGESIHVPAGSRVAVLCSTERLATLEGSAEWTLRADSCARGKKLPGGAYRNLSAESGTLRSAGKTRVWLRNSRHVPAKIPVPLVLSPRNSTIRQPQPRVFWTAIPGAQEYEIHWEGLGAPAQTVKAAEAGCGKGDGLWQGLDICSAPFPADRELEEGATAFLRVGGKVSLLGHIHREEKAISVRRLSARSAAALKAELEKVATAPADPLVRQLLEATPLSGRELWNEVLEHYELALSANEAPVLRVAAGDVLLAQESWDLAAAQYRLALQAARELEVEAAAARGLGQVEYVYGRFSEAADFFEKALRIFESRGLAAEAAEMKEAIEACAERESRPETENVDD